MGDIDWKLLRHNAQVVMRQAYAPYSGYAVGAAALVDDGRIVSGCNVENVFIRFEPVCRMRTRR